ncbi:MAG: beta-ketoacyl-[acyl-carrier-protein] synthase family protein [Candidatus Zixiibacteriota bacterium]
MQRQVIISGIGAVTACGLGADALWRHVVGGVSAVQPWPEAEASGLAVRIGAQVVGFDPERFVPRKMARRLDRSAQFALGAATMALADAGLNTSPASPERCGVFDGSSLGSTALVIEQLRKSLAGDNCAHGPSILVCGMSGNSSGAIAMQFGFKGPAVTLSHGSVSSACAVGHGLRGIERGDLDVAIVGGTEAPLHLDIVRPFVHAGVLSKFNGSPHAACRPFAADRDGFVLGEGAVYLVLEERQHAILRRAKMYCRAAGFAETCDAFHPTSPDPEGVMLAVAIRKALDDAELAPGEIGYVNLHGTATSANDPAECNAVRAIFGPTENQPACGSTKPVTGHLLGACGALEAAVIALAVDRQVIPPSINSTPRDPQCDINCAGDKSHKTDIQAAVSANCSFGGRNACLVFCKIDNGSSGKEYV